MKVFGYNLCFGKVDEFGRISFRCDKDGVVDISKLSSKKIKEYNRLVEDKSYFKEIRRVTDEYGILS